LTVAGDDIEPRRAIALLRLIRVPTGGGKVTRGGTDHRGKQFGLHPTIILSSITRPPMAAQDLSRIIPIGLEPPTNPLPQPAAGELRVLGVQIFDRAIAGWVRFQAAFDAYMEQFGASFKDLKIPDQATRNYATVFGLAHVVLGDEAVVPATARDHVDKVQQDLRGEA
jgi:hypothetical protein